LTKKGLESPLNFLCYDFTTDLFSSGEQDLDSTQSILAKFKPTKNLDLLRICNPQSSPSSFRSNFTNSEKPKPFLTKSAHDEVGLTLYRIFSSSQGAFSVAEFESITPQPRVLRPKPEENLEVKRSETIVEEVHEEISSNQSTDFSKSSLISSSQREIDSELSTPKENLRNSRQPESDSIIEYVPKDLYLQQQQTILFLQQQVEMLRQEIESLKHQQTPQNLPRVQVQDSVPQREISQLEEMESGSRGDFEELSGVEFIQTSYPHTEFEEEEESFLCEKPFEKCEMEAPSIFNFDLFVQSLRQQNGIPSPPINLTLLRHFVDINIIANRISSIFRSNISL
jgi:hypothetical protein